MGSKRSVNELTRRSVKRSEFLERTERYSGVGFPVGRNTPYKYIVVDIHYLPIVKNDKSGNQLMMSRKPYVPSLGSPSFVSTHLRCSVRRKYQAGVMLAGTSQIYLKPKSHSKRHRLRPQRSIDDFQLFELRSHVATTAHRYRFSPLVFTLISGVRTCVPLSNTRVSLMTLVCLARVNSLYRVRDGVVTQIVKGDPQWPQSFYPLATPVEIQTDDYLIGQCVYDNDDEQTVHASHPPPNGCNDVGV